MTVDRLAILVVCLATGVSAAQSAEPRQVAQAIDNAVFQRLSVAKIKPASLAEDAEFLRRVTLDLTGRIPTFEQADAFLKNTDPNRRVKLIEALLASPAHADHLARTWRDIIAPDELPNDGNGGGIPAKQMAAFTTWFTAEFQANERWPKIVEKLILAQNDQPQTFYYALVGDVKGAPTPFGAARNIASNFLGLQIQCAECHNDPFKEWKQSEFWGMAAFFQGVGGSAMNRKLEEKAKPAGAKAIIVPKTALKNAGVGYPARFLDGKTFTDETPQLLRPVFAKWAVDIDNPYLAPAFVNRLWSHFFARGIVEPVDDFRPDNPPSHPEILDLLTREFRSTGGDVRHLIRCIVLTDAYQRTSRTTGLKDAEETARLFGRMRLKVQTAEMLFESMKIAMEEKEIDLRTVDTKRKKVGDVEAALVRDAQHEFIKLFRTNKYDAAQFTHDIPQMLALLNHPEMHTGGNVVPKLLAQKLSDDEMVNRLYLIALARTPSNIEKSEAREFLAAAQDARIGYNELLWSLICRSEFLINR